MIRARPGQLWFEAVRKLLGHACLPCLQLLPSCYHCAVSIERFSETYLGLTVGSLNNLNLNFLPPSVFEVHRVIISIEIGSIEILDERA